MIPYERATCTTETPLLLRYNSSLLSYSRLAVQSAPYVVYLRTPIKTGLFRVPQSLQSFYYNNIKTNTMWMQDDGRSQGFAASLDSCNSLLHAPSSDEVDSFLSGISLEGDQEDFFFPSFNAIDEIPRASSLTVPQDLCLRRHHLDPEEELILGSSESPKSPIPFDNKANVSVDGKPQVTAASGIFREIGKVAPGMKRVASSATSLVEGAMKRVDSLLAMAA